MNNIAIKVREVNSEILIFLDKNFPNEISALREAAKILEREVIYRESHPNQYIGR